MGELFPSIKQHAFKPGKQRGQNAFQESKNDFGRRRPVSNSYDERKQKPFKHKQIDRDGKRPSSVLSSKSKWTRWIEVLTPRILRWLNKEIKFQPVVSDIETYFYSGYNFAQLLAKLGYPIGIQEISRIKNKEAYMHNFGILQSALQKTEIKTNMSLWKRVASRVPGAALWILAQLFKKTTHANESTDSDPYDYTLNLTTRDSTSATSTAASKPSATSKPAITPKGQPRTDVDTCKDWSCCHDFRHRPLDVKHLARNLVRTLLLKFASRSEVTGRRFLDDKQGKHLETVVGKALSSVVVALLHLNKRRWEHMQKNNSRSNGDRFLHGASPINFIAHQLMRHNQSVPTAQPPPAHHMLPRAVCTSQLEILMGQLKTYERSRLVLDTWKGWYSDFWTALKRRYHDVVEAEAAGVDFQGRNIPLYIIRKYFSEAMADAIHRPELARTAVSAVRKEVSKVIQITDIDRLNEELELLLPVLHRHSIAKDELRVLLDHLVTNWHAVEKSNFYGCPNSPRPFRTEASLDAFMFHIASDQVRRVVKLFNKDPKEIFREMDTNQDGKLSLAELEAGLSSLGNLLHDDPKDAARALYDALIRAGNKESIDIDTFERFVERYMNNVMWKRVRSVMKVMDDRRNDRFNKMLYVVQSRVSVAEGKRNNARRILAQTRAYVEKALTFGSNVSIRDKNSACQKAMQVFFRRFKRAEQLLDKSMMHQQLANEEIVNAINWHDMRLNLVATSKLALAQKCAAMSEKLIDQALKAMGGIVLAQRAAQKLRKEILQNDMEWRAKHPGVTSNAASNAEGWEGESTGQDRRWVFDSAVLAAKGATDAKKTLSHELEKKRVSKKRGNKIIYNYNAPLSELWKEEVLEEEASVVAKSFLVDWSRIRKKSSFQKLITELCGRDRKEVHKIKAVLQENHHQLDSMFEHYRHNALSQGNEYFTMGVFFIFVKECEILDKNSLDRRQACVCFQLARPDRKSPAKLRKAVRKDALLRYNFLELMVHLAVHKYGMLTESPSEALQEFLHSDVFAHSRDEVEVDPLLFRKTYLQDPKFISLLENYLPILMQIFIEFSHNKGKTNSRRRSQSPPQSPRSQSPQLESSRPGNPSEGDIADALAGVIKTDGGEEDLPSLEKALSPRAPTHLQDRHMNLKRWGKFCDAAKLIGYGEFSQRQSENCFYLSLSAMADELHRVKSRNVFLIFKGFIEAIARVAYSMQFPTEEELAQVGASGIVEFNSRRKHVTRFNLNISKSLKRPETPFERRLSMLLKMITSKLPAKKSKRHRKTGIVVPEVPSESIFNMDPTESIFGTDQNDNKFSTDALTADSDSKQLSVEPKKSLDGTTK